ncbi:MAG: saccharopine dehydrogenase NADP-binding domain-containing protein [Anaerolineales bacterium]|nr:saccharopine dehydrogenase NADP-binding domain-containing protein [Anaerolineales bacterium]MCA9927005.1 saccharopine dehydrogenase NADP-binding domain-containing protein [Anaerolineales bacterium]
MKIIVLGSGLMGPAAAYNAMRDPEVTRVTICDVSQAQLDTCAELLTDKPGADKLTLKQLDLSNRADAVAVLAEYDAAVAALPRPVNILAIEAALQSGTPLVDLSQTPPEEMARMSDEFETDERLIVLGCGVEPGLTEIMARHLAEKMDRVDELHIKCGGIPEKPQPPLGYKIVFGGRKMPLREWDSEVVRNGQIEYVPRYSDAEPVTFAGVGDCEAWHEGFKPWILDIPELKNIRRGTQKTVRWPGYAEKITVLRELGLLSLEPVLVDGVAVVPKHLVDAVLYPKVRLEAGERDITCFRVELVGEMNGKLCTYKAEMVDWLDEVTGFTSMARTTAFPGAIVARMIASGRLAAGKRPFVTPEKIIAGAEFDYLMAELAEMGITFEITIEENNSE